MDQKSEEICTSDGTSEEISLTEELRNRIKVEVENAMADAFTDVVKSLKRTRKRTDDNKRKCIRYELCSREIYRALNYIVDLLIEKKFFEVVENPVKTAGYVRKRKYYISSDEKTIYDKNLIPFIIFGKNGLVQISSNYLADFCVAVLKNTRSYLPFKYFYQLFAIDEKSTIIAKAEHVSILSKRVKGVEKLNAMEEEECAHPSFEEQYYDLVRLMWNVVYEEYPVNQLSSIPIIIRNILMRMCDMKYDLSDSDRRYISQERILMKAMEEQVRYPKMTSDLKKFIREILSEGGKTRE